MPNGAHLDVQFGIEATYGPYRDMTRSALQTAFGYGTFNSTPTGVWQLSGWLAYTNIFGPTPWASGGEDWLRRIY